MPRGFSRNDRVASLIREQIHGILVRNVKDPRVGFVTVTGVDVTGDLHHATVRVSCLGDPSERQETFRALERASGFVRRELASRLRLKQTPELHFREDSSPRDSLRIEELISDWRTQDKPESVPGKNLDADDAMRRIAELIGRGNRFLLTTHLFPDGDSLGSALALAGALGKLGKEAVVLTHDPVPDRYRFLPGAARVETRPLLGNVAYDAAFAFECPDVGRTGFADLAGSYYVVNIDHHEDNSLFGDLNWVDTRSPAVGEMVLRLVRALDVPVGADIATCIYTAVMTDTGSFTYSNTTAQGLRLGAEMVDLGANPYRIALEVYDSNRFEKLDLVGRALAGMTRELGDRVAWVKVDGEDLAASGAGWTDVDDLVNYPRSIRGVEVAIIFKELAAERFRVSLRSKGEVDVFRVAKAFGGGGHRNAAGCSVAGSFEDVRARVLREVRDALASTPASARS